MDPRFLKQYPEKIRLKKLLQHDCQLPDLHKNLLVQFIDSGYCVNFRRKFHSLLICSEKNPRSKLFLKSSAAIYMEIQRHLQAHYHMIHPFSLMRVGWELFMMIILCILLIYIPIDICFAGAATVYTRICRIVLDCICMLDIALSFITGYQDSMTKKIVMNNKMVAKNYLKTWFILDFVSSLNTDIMIMIMRLYQVQAWALKIPSILKIFRLITLMKYMDRFREWREYSLYKFKMIRMILLFVLSVLWGACGLYLIASYVGEEWVPKPESKEGGPDLSDVWLGIRSCIVRIMMNFFLISHGEKNSHRLVVIFIEIILVSIGWCIKLSVTAQIVQIVMKYSSLNDKYYQMVQQFQEYMKSKSLPDSVQKRVLDYFEFRFQRNYYKESEILASLSNHLKQQIILHTCGSLLTNSEVFKDVPLPFLERVSYMMKMEIFLPSDVIIISGSEADTIYFILTGMVAVYDEEGKEKCHLADGSYFGEMSLFVSEEHYKASVVSIDFCEMYTLSREHFYEAVAPYPELLEKLWKQAKLRLKDFFTEEEERLYMSTSSDIKGGRKTASKTRMYYYV